MSEYLFIGGLADGRQIDVPDDTEYWREVEKPPAFPSDTQTVKSDVYSKMIMVHSQSGKKYAYVLHGRDHAWAMARLFERHHEMNVAIEGFRELHDYIINVFGPQKFKGPTAKAAELLKKYNK